MNGYKAVSFKWLDFKGAELAEYEWKNDEGLVVVGEHGAGKSDVSTLQWIGRLLRNGTDDEEVLFYDFFDTDNSYLIEHSEQRKRAYKNEKFEIREFRGG